MDTIAAISTPPGEGGIGIVRVSGPSALHIAKRVFRGRREGELKSHRLYHGEILDPDGGEVVDEVLLAFFRAPRSYTGEDTIEIYGHGGTLVLTRILDAVCRSGARLAEPGEFTKRAFLNGRLDLSQAEAVIDVIRAKTDLSLSIARDQLRGRLSKEINRIKDGLSDLLAHVEAELDFPEEEDVGELSQETLLSAVSEAKRGIDSLLSTYREGRALREGLKVVIAGRPNAGKSSLLNALLREERAIVTPTPGTTRDVIEEVINIKGIPVRLMDTAGLRDTVEEVESIGIRLARERLEAADLVLYVVDGGGDVRGDLPILEGINREMIVVVNKRDLLDRERLEEVEGVFSSYRHVSVSALYGDGMDLLEEAIYRHVVRGPGLEAEAVITKERHKVCLEEAMASLLRCEEVISRALPKELFATELRIALDRLGRITGEVTTEDILDRIFSQFCVGK